MELDGVDHLPWYGDTDAILGEIDRSFGSVLDEEAEFDRLLATVMFTDIVGSTRRASHMGDRAWRQLLASHRQRLRGLLARYRSREVDTAGDGFLATFDGPARASTVKDLVAGSGLTFEDAGEYELEGVPERWHLSRQAPRRSCLGRYAGTDVDGDAPDIVALELDLTGVQPYADLEADISHRLGDRHRASDLPGPGVAEWGSVRNDSCVRLRGHAPSERPRTAVPFDAWRRHRHAAGKLVS